MPDGIDLTGRRFGKLTVVEFAGHHRGWARPKKQWLCKCDCGRKEVILQERLPHADYVVRYRHAHWACFVCRKTAICAVCETEFLSIKGDKTCSVACTKTYDRQLSRAAYSRRKEKDPLIGIRKWKKRQASIQGDPVLAEEQRRRRREYKKRRRMTK